MSALSLRLPDHLDAKLNEESRREGVPRSEIAREAIADFLARRERERLVAAFVAEARAGYGNPTIRAEAIEVAEEALTTDNENLAQLEAPQGRPQRSQRTKSGKRR